MTDAERFVREVYPNAICCGPNKPGPPMKVGYMVVVNPDFTGHFAMGDTEIEAWSNLANRLLKEMNGEKVMCPHGKQIWPPNRRTRNV